MKIEIKVKFSATVPPMPLSDFDDCIDAFILPAVSAEDWLFSLSPTTACFLPHPHSLPGRDPIYFEALNLTYSSWWLARANQPHVYLSAVEAG